MTPTEQMEAMIAKFQERMEAFQNDYAAARGVSKDQIFNK